MDLKENLVLWIQKAVGGCARHWAELIADELVAHGVTVQEPEQCWTSVEDGLPEHRKENFTEYIVNVTRSHWPTSSYDVIDAPYSEEYVTTALYDSDQKVWHLVRSEVVLNALLPAEDAPLNGEFVTYWMPMPELPKEG